MSTITRCMDNWMLSDMVKETEFDYRETDGQDERNVYLEAVRTHDKLVYAYNDRHKGK